MSTPEIDLANMLEAEDKQDKLDDAYARWVKYTVISDLTKYLSTFNYEKFDTAVTIFKIHDGDGIVSWLYSPAQEQFELFQAIATRDWDDLAVRDLVESYINCFVCEQNFIDYNREVICNDHS